jgi:hypothetical protein
MLYLTLAFACSEVKTNSKPPNFSLLDVNPNSESNQQMVSSDDYLGQVSAWYFGHAT